MRRPIRAIRAVGPRRPGVAATRIAEVARAVATAMKVAMLVTAAVLATLFPLAGCSPEVDWREFPWKPGGFQVLLPAKPADETRDIILGANGEWKLRLTLFSTRLTGAAVAVGYADLPPGMDAAARRALLASARDAFLGNAGAARSEGTPVPLEGDPQALGIEFRGNGMSGSVPVAIIGRVYATDSRFYQLLYVGPPDHRAVQDLHLFLNSLRLSR